MVFDYLWFNDEISELGLFAEVNRKTIEVFRPNGSLLISFDHLSDDQYLWALNSVKGELNKSLYRSEFDWFKGELEGLGLNALLESSTLTIFNDNDGTLFEEYMCIGDGQYQHILEAIKQTIIDNDLTRELKLDKADPFFYLDRDDYALKILVGLLPSRQIESDLEMCNRAYDLADTMIKLAKGSKQ
jgi:hypothetical protein